MQRSPSRTSLVKVENRADLVKARRIVIKAGTSVVTNEDGQLSLTRISSIVEQISELRSQGVEVILVTSGAVGCGRMRLRKQGILSANFHQQLRSVGMGSLSASATSGYNSACASAGQLGLMSLYDTLFSQCDVSVSQFLLTSYDFTDESRKKHLRTSMEQIILHGMVPIVNENDAVSGNQGYTAENVFSDNDALASIVAGQMNAEVLVLLTDVEGLYDRPPSEPGAAIIDTYHRGTEVTIGDKSARGRGGMGAKVDSALRALDGGVQAVVIASGKRMGVIVDVMSARPVGTLFVSGARTGADPSFPQAEGPSAAAAAAAAREAARCLQALSSEQRSGALAAVAQALRDRSQDILEANAADLAEATANKLDPPLLQRLKLTAEKLETVAAGVEALASGEEPLGRLLKRTEVAEGLELTQLTVPIGVLLVVFESRPDSLPQIAALALRSGNGLLLKGGKEAQHSNRALHRVIVDAIHASCGVPEALVSLVEGREAVADLLKLDTLVDLVIPRGGRALVDHVKAHTKIPVLGHSDGICHVFVDASAETKKAVSIVIDAKTDYPSGCNACETVLFHEAVVGTVLNDVLRALRQSGVTLKAGPRAVELGILPAADAAGDMAVEYGNLTCLVEVVSGVAAAVAHVNTYGSHHTDAIITEDQESAARFLAGCDSACVFHNASTRFADGYRFGLGAEVGISTGKIHARGPVGVEGLLSTKWLLKSKEGDTVSAFSGETPARVYTHKHLPL